MAETIERLTEAVAILQSQWGARSDCPAGADGSEPVIQPPSFEPTGATREKCEMPSITNGDSLADWLQRRGIRLVAQRIPHPSDRPLDDLARQLGTQFELLAPLPEALRRAAGADRPVTVALRDAGSQSVGAITAMVAQLHEIGLLTVGRYE
jgi:hypothetical protein